MTLSPAADPRGAPLDPHVVLAGRPPIAEFLALVKKAPTDAGLGGPTPPEADLVADWRSANDHLRELERTEAGIADHPPLEPLPQAVAALADRLTADPAFQRLHGAVPARFAMVELDRLVVYQKQINLAQVDTVKRELGSQPTTEAIARVALGLDRYSPPVRLVQSQDVFTFICDSKDFRFIEPMVMLPESLPSLPARGIPARCVVLAVGFSSNCIGAIHAGNRLILFNGSHRAYALRDLGITHVPCVVRETSRKEEIELIANREISSREDLYLRNPRPPLLKDYFDDRLRRLVPLVKTNRLIRVQLRIDQSEVPGL